MNVTSENVKHFIFEYIDSVEQLEVLLFLKKNPDIWWTAISINNELKANPRSIANRLTTLITTGLVQAKENTPPEYKYEPKTLELAALADELAEAYRIRPHKILELIFSPLKKARNFANAFTISGPPKRNGENNG